MATISFLVRSKESDSTSIYFRFRNGRNFDLTLKTPYQCNPTLWNSKSQRIENPFNGRTPKTASSKVLKNNIETTNNNLSLFESDINNYFIINPKCSKEELKNYVNTKYFPSKEKIKTKEETLNTLFTNCIELYIVQKSRRIEGKQRPISDATKKKLTTIKNNIHKYNRKLDISDINDDFREYFALHMQKLKYSSSTIIKDLKYIKSICKHFSKKINVSTDVLIWEFIHSKKPYVDPTFNNDEIETLKEVELTHDYLDNARDWLIIGLNIGARVSDLLDLTSENIIDNEFIQYNQKKTENQSKTSEAYGIISEDIRIILEKRNGEFPRKISHQKFNDYIKLVAKECNFDEEILGGKIGDDLKKKIAMYPKWELVTSHIMRRSFITNHINLIGIDQIKNLTGHKTDSMVGLYDKTQNLDKVKEIKRHLDNLLKNKIP